MEIKNYQKVAVVFVILFASFASLAGMANAAVDPNVVLSNYTVSANPATPGQIVSVTMQFTNIVSTPCAEQVSVQVSDSYPLSVLGPDTQYFPNNLCNSDSPAADTLVFKVPVDALGQTGTYPISVTASYQKDFLKYTTSNVIDLQVVGQPVLTASVLSSNPVEIYPGDSGTIIVQFSNTGNGPIESASATLSSKSGVEVKWAGATQQLGQIQPHTSVDATFNVEAPKSLASGNYPLSLDVSYTDEQNVNSVSNMFLVLPVKPKAEFVASSDGQQLVIGHQDLTDITLTNTGSQAAKKLKVTILPVYPFGTDGTIRYVDDLEPGKTVDLSYMITVDKQATSGQQILSVQMNFEDPNGKKLSDTSDFALNVRGETLTEQLEGYWYLLLLALIVAVVLIRRRMAGGKKGSEK